MRKSWKEVVATVSISLLVTGDGAYLAQTAPPPASPAPTASPAPEAAPKLPADQLDSLVAPIALYPDALLAQTLVASTYPLEIIQLQQWLAKNPKLKDKALADAVAKQDWDPSIQTMAATPEVVKRLADDIQWTTDLGNAFLAQQADVMEACQRMRKKAKDKGALESNEQQKVETKTEGDKTIIVVEQSNPEVIYVPSYSPTVVYGAPIYPYPPIYYPPYTPGAAFVSFSFGVFMGAAIWGGSCCGCGWGHGGYGNVNINVNNNFNRNNINTGNINTGNINRGNNNWQHNPEHRGGAPYKDKATANKYGGNARGDSLSQRQAKAGQQPSRGGGAGGGAGARPSGPSASTRPSGGGAGNRASTPSNQIGSRNVGGSPSASTRGGGFGGSSGGYSGSSARSAGSRGSSSYGGSRGGGSRGGGGGGRRR